MVFAGPNGSGKSSIHEKLQPPGEFVNADEIEKSLPAELKHNARQVKAGRMAIDRIKELIKAKTDFSFETTLSSQHSISVLERAKAAGFRVSILYVTLDKPERNVERVRFRVAGGGHDIPPDTIVRRYETSLANLSKALEIVDEAVIIDNSAHKPRWVVKVRGDQVVETNGRTSSELHRRLIDLVEKACSKKTGWF